MQRAVAALRLSPSLVLVDGNRLPALNHPARAIVGGDSKVDCIAAASILAKVQRDRWCMQIDAQWPQYGFASHKGYGTREHLEALANNGPTPVHRRSFAPVRAALQPILSLNANVSS
jgi:ribonuclease HII